VRVTVVVRVVMAVTNLAACYNQTIPPDAALRSLTEGVFSRQYTSAFWDAERTKQSPCWNEARAYCDLPVHRLAPNCRIVNAIVKETNPTEDEEALALVREALREQDQRRERKAWEGLGFGGVMRRESQASASTRREPAARSRFQATRE
jgi:hypothetical protein